MSKEAVIEVRKEDNAINLETFTTMCGPDVGLGTGTWISRGMHNIHLEFFILHQRPLPEICKVSVNIRQVDPGKTLFGLKTINFQAPKWPKKRFINTYLGMCLGQSDN